MIIQMSYFSRATSAMDDLALVALLDKARIKNFRRGIGGLLLYRDSTFLQIIEGRAPDVESLFETISKDPRHYGIRLLLREEVTERVFFAWRMGFLTPEALIHAHPYFSPALAQDEQTEPDAQFAQELIGLFRTGALADLVVDA